MNNAGTITSAEEVRENLRNRDYIDSHREESPLVVQAKDAIVLDNTNLTMEDQLQLAYKLASEAINRLSTINGRRLMYQYSVNNLPDWLQENKHSSMLFLTDDNTSKFCLPKIEAFLPAAYLHVTIPAGETSKTIDSAQVIWNKLLENNINRNALMINLGGGDHYRSWRLLCCNL